MPRILAIDPGERRVGLALSDPGGLIASPYDTLTVKSQDRLVQDLLRIIREREVGLVLVGFPVREDGYEGDGCRRSRRLLERLLASGVSAMLWDETLSTRRAADVAAEHGLRPRRSSKGRDSVAASFILSDYLSSHPV